MYDIELGLSLGSFGVHEGEDGGCIEAGRCPVSSHAAVLVPVTDRAYVICLTFSTAF